MDSYVEDKKLIFADQDKNDFTILDFDEDNYLKETASPKRGCRCWGDLFASETKAKVLRYSKVLLPKGISGAYLEKSGSSYKGVARVPSEFV